MSWTASKTWAIGDLFTAGDANVWIKGNLDWLKGDAAWQTPAFLNGWVNNPGWTPAGYRQVGDSVYLRGNVYGGTWGTPICMVPAAYRPLYDTFIGVLTNDTVCNFLVKALDGGVQPSTGVGGSNSYVELSQVRWFTT